MSDEAVVVPNPVPGEVTPGTLLRQAREATGLHIAALAVSMKVPVKKLEALEADRLHELPDAVFVRALAASVCRTLKVDPTPILNKLPQSVAPKLDKSDSGVRMPALAPGFLAGHSPLALLSRPSVLLVAALLLAALGVLLLPDSRSGGVAGLPKLVPAVPMAAPPAKDIEASVAPPPSDKAAPAAPVAELASPATSVPVVAAAVAAAAPTKAASASVADSASGLLVFKASARAWIRVSDSRGSVQFEKTLAAGESASASGTPPLAVIVGNVAATEVVLRGQPFALEPVTQNNVARFEVK